jgi:hypothetical protein
MIAESSKTTLNALLALASALASVACLNHECPPRVSGRSFVNAKRTLRCLVTKMHTWTDCVGRQGRAATPASRGKGERQGLPAPAERHITHLPSICCCDLPAAPCAPVEESLTRPPVITQWRRAPRGRRCECCRG